jgi:hypothetical protein
LLAVGEAFEKTEEHLNFRLRVEQFKGKELEIREMEVRERILRYIIAASQAEDQ